MSKLANRRQVKEVIRPGWRESEFAKTIDGQVMLLIDRAIKNKHYLEAQTLSWAIIEQLLLPRLFTFIGKTLKISIPQNIFKRTIENIILCYLFISHDEELYNMLNMGRKKRNQIFHKICEQKNIESINRFAKASLLLNLNIQKDIMKRFSGEFPIPSINLYRNGWNDAIAAFLKELNCGSK
jgi:hypothetical protein